MANGFGSLYIGAEGLKNSQQALNVTANNLANLDTAGYVRQQVIFADRNYWTWDTTTAVSKQQSGLGVRIGDVLHRRDVFLDSAYRTESGRQAFYAATAEAAMEVETYFQELEGEAFQDSVESFWEAFQELAKQPDESIYQNLVVQQAQLFLSRATELYSGLRSYQQNINVQIQDNIDRINELGERIFELNLQIQRIETGGVETAMTLRDERDNALDELASLANISYEESATGIVSVSVEGTEFVNEVSVYEMGSKTDRLTGFVTPYWPHLSDEKLEIYTEVFNFNVDISTENNNDIGELKALVLARGDHVADYTDVEGLDADTYNDTTGMSVMLKAQAEFDQMMHGIMTAINDIFCPNINASEGIDFLANNPNGSIMATGAGGVTYQITANTKILDAENCAVGLDGELPPRELFVRIGTERYTEVTYIDPATGESKTAYIYNEEDMLDASKRYTLASVEVNRELAIDESLLPHLTQNNAVDMAMAERLVKVWEEGRLTLNPNDTRALTFKDYYVNMSGEMATFANIYDTTARSLAGTVLSVENQRLQVIGVSSDEELTYMIKYQNAYNASSRFINVVDEMIEHLITQLG